MSENTQIPEYQKAAALMAMDIDTLFNCAENEPEKAMEFFRLLRDMALDVQTNAEGRNIRYAAVASILQAVKNGEVQTDMFDDGETSGM